MRESSTDHRSDPSFVSSSLLLLLQALAVASYYHDDWPLLVICPSSLRLNWESEIYRWLPILSKEHVFVILNAKDGRACLTRDETSKKVQGHAFGVVIISYDLVAKLESEIKKYKFGVVIADESHNLKSGKAQRTKSILPILKAATRAILLSGTRQRQTHAHTSIRHACGILFPTLIFILILIRRSCVKLFVLPPPAAMNRPAELFTQISALKPGLFPRFEEFGMRYDKKGMIKHTPLA